MRQEKNASARITLCPEEGKKGSRTSEVSILPFPLCEQAECSIVLFGLEIAEVH